MASTILVHPGTYTRERSRTSIVRRFLDWSTNQQENRLLWLGIALTAQGCVLAPITIFAVVLAGTNIALFMAAIVAMAMALVTNLAALPTKYTIPIFLFSILIDLGIVIACASIGFHPTVGAI